MLRVIIADDHPVVLIGLREIIKDSFHDVTVDETRRGYEAISRIQNNRYDAAILDIALPDISGLDAVREIKKRKPKLPVLVMSMHPDEHYALRAIRAGGQGYVSKRSSVSEFVQALQKILAGKRYVNPTFAEQVLFEVESDAERPPHERLSNRELQVACMIGRGKTIKQITEELHLSMNTIRTYRARVMEKMGVKATSELIRYAMKHSLVE
ncbi:MAG: Response regulator UvrY [Syntrophorhabdaceae bacterium PtaU1.Bin034]|jgi:DNA-binding NarL/FixJ family response regulator|nr:MAG: Response regulator UvrY [Syntrophorhabdaceae bacterium PtaU1.Bin034]